MSTGKEDFAARLARIQSGGVGCKGTIYAGHDETFYQKKEFKAPPPRSKEVAENLTFVGGYVGAFLLGMLGVAFGRYARFHLMEGAEFDGDFDMVVNFAMGAATAFVLSQMFRLDKKIHRSLQATGVFVMVCTFHNLVHWMPRVFETVFSPVWVEQVQTATAPNSILFRGNTFLLDPNAVPKDEFALLEDEMKAEDSAGQPETSNAAEPTADTRSAPEVRITAGGAKFTTAP